jgi:N-methylhydantoinase A
MCSQNPERVAGGKLMSYTIDIDTGGTFTDGFFVEGARVKTVKVPTTPHDLTVCFLDCIKAGAAQFGAAVEDMLMETDVIRFSTTVGTNTLIERNGTRIGLLVSRGEETDLQVTNGEDEFPLVYPEMVRTLTTEGGTPDREEVLRVGQELLDQGARCLVVSLKGSVDDPLAEKLVRTWFKSEYPRDYLGSVPVFLASDITNLPGEQERINTAVINAYIHARLVKFLYKAGEDLRRRFYSKPLLIVHATGGVARVAKTKSINTYNSGPAAGLLGVSSLSRLYDIKHMISGDMGGTSFDIGIIRNGQPNFTLKPVVEGLPLSTPMVAIKAIGAGGGSIASVRRGELQVGPQSAGALPGPACFNLGGNNATVTDADVVLGYIDPGYYLGGKMKLEKEMAAQAIESKIATPLNITAMEAALAIRDNVDRYMGLEMKSVMESAGADFNPVMVIYGGAGSTHCCGLASYAGIKRIIAPQFASVFSACSLSGMDIWHIYSRRAALWVKENGIVIDGSKIVEEAVKSMHAEAARDMRGEGFTEDEVSYLIEFFLSRGDDNPEGRVALKGLEWKGELGDALERQSQRLSKESRIYSPAMFLHATARVPHFVVEASTLAGKESSHAYMGNRLMCWNKESGMVDTPVYNRSKMLPGNSVMGPAVVEAADTTYVVREGWTYTIDEYCNGVFEEATA